MVKNLMIILQEEKNIGKKPIYKEISKKSRGQFNNKTFKKILEYVLKNHQYLSNVDLLIINNIKKYLKVCELNPLDYEINLIINKKYKLKLIDQIKPIYILNNVTIKNKLYDQLEIIVSLDNIKK